MQSKMAANLQTLFFKIIVLYENVFDSNVIETYSQGSH